MQVNGTWSGVGIFQRLGSSVQILLMPNYNRKECLASLSSNLREATMIYRFWCISISIGFCDFLLWQRLFQCEIIQPLPALLEQLGCLFEDMGEKLRMVDPITERIRAFAAGCWRFLRLWSDLDLVSLGSRMPASDPSRHHVRVVNLSLLPFSCDNCLSSFLYAIVCRSQLVLK